MYGVPPLHLMLEEDSRYSRNALGTRTTTYWLPDTREYLIALFKCLSYQRMLTTYLQYVELIGETAMSRELEAMC